MLQKLFTLYLNIIIIQTTFGILNDKLDEQVRILVEEPIKEDDPKPFKLVKNLYQACMNKCKINLIKINFI